MKLKTYIVLSKGTGGVKDHISRTLRNIFNQVSQILAPLFVPLVAPSRNGTSTNEISRPSGIRSPGAIDGAGSVTTLAPRCPLSLPHC